MNRQAKRMMILGMAASLLLVAVPASGADANAPRLDADAAIREKLERQIDKLSFAEIDFKDVITFFCEYSGANIQVDWRALTIVGIEQTTKVSVDVRKVTVMRALELVLRDVSGFAAGADAELRYMIDGGVLTISTKADLAKKFVRRTYDVRDLLVQGGSEASLRQRVKTLVPMIHGLIDGESWGDLRDGSSPATPGLIHLSAGRLVVTQTVLNHQALAKLIDELREVQKTPHNCQVPPAGEPAPDAALRKMLTREIDRLSFDDIDFRDVITFIRKDSGTNIHVNWRALSNAGIEDVTKVRVDVRKVTVKQALDLVLRDVSGAAAGADAELRYMIDGGILMISTKSDLAKDSVRRIYDVRDLLMQDGSGATQREREMARDAMAENLANLIRNSIDPESWASPDYGVCAGMPGFIQCFGGLLVVAQTSSNHKALAELLDMLRKAKATQRGKAEPDAEAALRKKFEKSIEWLSFTDIDLSDVITFLREYSEANIHVNWRALISVGIEKTTKVSVEVRNIPVGRALDLVLRDVSATTARADAELDYVIDRDVLIISTGSDLSVNPICRVYDVRDLAVRNGSGLSGRKMENLVALIRDSIDRESWADPDGGWGGVPGFIQVFEGLLVVTQTAPNHKALAELFDKLRKAKASKKQHGTQTVKEEDVGFADVPQELDVPRVGNLVKFEKTLIRPADRLTIRAEYTWKGAVK